MNKKDLPKRCYKKQNLQKLMILTGKDTDELFELLTKYFEGKIDGWVEVRSIKTRFDLSWDSAEELESSTLKRAAQDIVYQIIDENKEEEFFTYMINKDVDLEDYEQILKRHGLTVEENGDKFSLSTLSGKILEDEEEKIISYIENHASEQTISYLQKAKQDFDSGHYYDTLANCRLSLESLTKHGNFTNGISELVSTGLIEDGTNERKKDGWLLRAMWGYNSTLGSHTSSESSTPTFEQALFSMVLTKSTIRFILKKLEDAKSQNITLDEWQEFF